MTSSAIDPRRLLDALRVGSPLDFSEADQAAARSLLAHSAPSERELELIQTLPEPLALAVIHDLVQRRVPALLEALAVSGTRALAKAAKRGLYQLRSAGVASPRTPPGARPAPPPATVAPASGGGEVVPWLASEVSSAGEQLIWAVRPLRGGGVESLQFLLHDEVGFVGFEAEELSRAQLRALRRGLTLKSVCLVEIDPALARDRLAGALELARRGGHRLPAGTDTALRHLSIEPRALPPIEGPTPDDWVLARRGAELFQCPELSAWLPSAEGLRLMAERVVAVLTSPLQLSDTQRREALRQRLESTAAGYFDAPTRERYARRLGASADVFESSDRPALAALARSTGRVLAHDPELGAFSLGLFDKALDLFLSEGAKESDAPAAPGNRPEKAGSRIIVP